MDYSLNIVASVKGQARLDATLKTIGQIRSLAKDIKPLDLLSPGAGKAGDEIRKAKTELDKLARSATNNEAVFSKTFGGARSQAQAFASALDNVGLKLNLPFNEQVAEVKNYANALAQAEAQAEKLGKLQNEVIQDARKRAGVAIGPATQLGSPEAAAQQVRFESSQITKANNLRKEQVKLVGRINALASSNVQVGQFNSQVARINLALDEKRVDAAEEMSEELKEQIRQNEKIIKQNKTKGKDAKDEAKSAKKNSRTRIQRLGDAAQGAILGGGFPLLFGGPSFAAAGGLLGGGISGGAFGQKASFAGGIGGSVIGTVFDNMIKSALELGKALENPTKNIQALVNALPIAGTKTKRLIDQLNNVGLSSVASSLALQTLDEELSSFGLDKGEIEELKKQTEEFDNVFKKLQLAGAAMASEGLINFMTLLTKLVVSFKESKGPLVQAVGGIASFILRSDSTEEFLKNKPERLKAFDEATVSAGSLAQKSDPLKPFRTEEEIKAAALIANLAKRKVKLAEDTALIEQESLRLTRGRLAEAKAIVGIDRAQIAFDKASLNFESESNVVQKEVLRTKKEIARFALIEAQAARENATTLRKQADAAFELGRSLKAQALVRKQANAESAAQKAIRATSPFENQQFMADPFFGGSNKLQSDQVFAYTETLKAMNAELDTVYKNFEFGIDLSQQEKLALVDKAIALEKDIELYQRLQPAIDESALAQARFNDALAITVPVTDSLFDSLLAVAEGTKTAEQAFADFLRSIASMLVDAAKQMIAQYIAIGVARMFAGFPGVNLGKNPNFFQQGPPPLPPLPAKALGGAVTAGRPYLVGERGPEMFVPGAQGNIVPNNAMGGGASVTVNVDASGSSVEGDGNQAAQLGKAIGIAVQQELIKQKRPGGLLTR